MFIDKAKVTLVAGRGGDGMISFRREKYVPRGGPNGGNGGRGGSIYFVATSNSSTLSDFRYKKVISAPNGENGGIKNMFGKKGSDLFVNVPLGSLVFKEPEHIVIADFTHNGQTKLMAKGGRGGRGNAAFRTSVRKAPRIAENGVPGEKIELSIELKLLADVGLVGFPNAGKSTLLNVISNARPEIGDYPFTTLAPELGLVTTKDGRSFVVADLPGLIEGASKGKGLGFEFLQHIERCRIIAIMLDFEAKQDPYEAYQLLLNELNTYNKALGELPRIIIASKFETDEAKEKLAKLKTQVTDEIYPISSLLQEGLEELKYALMNKLEKLPIKEFAKDDGSTENYKIYELTDEKEEEPFTVVKLNDHEYELKGDAISRAYHKYNLSTDEALLHLLKYLRDIGVDEYLDKLNLEDGDLVHLEDFTFEYIK
jgi:GTP-binding protein